ANGETIEVTMKDGTRLVGWYLKPEVGGGRGRLGEVVPHRINLPQPPPASATSPGLLWLYGNGENIAAIWPIVREFQPPGTAVLVVDYPGYGGSAGRATETALYGAADAAYAALVARPGVDPGRIYVYGRSLGTAAATGVGGPTGTNCGSSSNDHHRHDPIPLLLELSLRVVERAQHGRIVAVGELRAPRHASREPAHGHEGPGHLAALHVWVGVARDEQLLEQREGTLLGEDVQ